MKKENEISVQFHFIVKNSSIRKFQIKTHHIFQINIIITIFDTTLTLLEESIIPTQHLSSSAIQKIIKRRYPSISSAIVLGLQLTM